MNGHRDLAALDLRALAQGLASHSPSTRELGPGEWLSVVELLTLRLADDFGNLPTEFRRVCSAAVAYALDSAVASGSIDQRESVIRRLNLSLVLLGQVPPDAEIDILDPERLIELLLSELPVSAEEARMMSADWRALDIVQVRALRAAKNLLSPGLAISRLVSDGGLDTRLQAWEEVLPSLP